MAASEQPPANVSPTFNIYDPRYPRPKWVRYFRQELPTIQASWISGSIITSLFSLIMAAGYGLNYFLLLPTIVALILVAITLVVRWVKRDEARERLICAERERKEQENVNRGVSHDPPDAVSPSPLTDSPYPRPDWVRFLRSSKIPGSQVLWGQVSYLAFCFVWFGICYGITLVVAISFFVIGINGELPGPIWLLSYQISSPFVYVFFKYWAPEDEECENAARQKYEHQKRQEYIQEWQEAQKTGKKILYSNPNFDDLRYPRSNGFRILRGGIIRFLHPVSVWLVVIALWSPILDYIVVLYTLQGHYFFSDPKLLALSTHAVFTTIILWALYRVLRPKALQDQERERSVLERESPEKGLSDDVCYPRPLWFRKLRNGTIWSFHPVVIWLIGIALWTPLVVFIFSNNDFVIRFFARNGLSHDRRIVPILLMALIPLLITSVLVVLSLFLRPDALHDMEREQSILHDDSLYLCPIWFRILRSGIIRFFHPVIAWLVGIALWIPLAFFVYNNSSFVLLVFQALNTNKGDSISNNPRIASALALMFIPLLLIIILWVFCARLRPIVLDERKAEQCTLERRTSLQENKMDEEDEPVLSHDPHYPRSAGFIRLRKIAFFFRPLVSWIIVGILWSPFVVFVFSQRRYTKSGGMNLMLGITEVISLQKSSPGIFYICLGSLALVVIMTLLVWWLCTFGRSKAEADQLIEQEVLERYEQVSELRRYKKASKGSAESEHPLLPLGFRVRHQLLYPGSGYTDVQWSSDGSILACISSTWLKFGEGLTANYITSHSVSGNIGTALSSNGQLFATFSEKQVILYSISKSEMLHALSGHFDNVTCVALSPDRTTVASGAKDSTIGLWNVHTGDFLNILKEHTDCICCLAYSLNGRMFASGSEDGTLRLWNTQTWHIQHVLEHMKTVTCVTWSSDGSLLASGSHDNTIRLWNPKTGQCIRVLEGHAAYIHKLSFSFDGCLLASQSHDGTIRLWRTDTWELIAQLNDYAALKKIYAFAFHPRLPIAASVCTGDWGLYTWNMSIATLLGSAPLSSVDSISYANAKVVLVGNTGVGKSGLGLVLSGKPFVATEATHGRRVWTFDSQEVSLDERRKETRETLLWDLAGQPGYRLIHQLYLNEVTVALVVFDAHSETDPFAGVRHWDKALCQAQRIQGSVALPLKKLLVAARIDRGGIGVSSERMQTLVKELGFDGYFETSAKEGWQIEELREAICRQIDWEALPKVTSTVLFQQIKQFLLDEKERARQLISTVDGIYSTFLNSKDIPTETPELPAQFETCIGRVESAGLIKRLSFGKLVLLQPELLDAYASALVNFVKDEPDGLGSVAEEQVRACDFRMPADERIKDTDQEKLLLIAMVEDLLRRELVLREDGMLIFPSQSTKEHPDLPDPEGKAAVFEFEGPVLNIYATLAVRLARSGSFRKKELWKNAITYTTSLSGTYGMYLHNISEGRGKLTLFFDKVASRDTRRIFEEYVRLHLMRRALPNGFKVHRILACGECNTIISDEIIQRRKERDLDWLNCPVCDVRVSLLEHERQLTAVPSSSTRKMDQAADTQRDLEAAKSTLQGKIETRDFDVFLCHHGVDKSAVKRIGEELKERGILPWLDEWELRPGLPWQRLLEEQIAQIKTAAVFVGKNGRGPWQDAELYAFLRQFAKRECPVIPVVLPDCESAPDLPIFLEGMTWVDFRKREPEAMQRLLWGITGRRNVG